MGGDMQPQGHVQILVNLFDFGMNLQEAGDAPRAYHTGSSDPNGLEMVEGGTLSLEAGFSLETRSELERRGHHLGNARTALFGGYQAVLWDATNRVWIGATESRKDGNAAGGQIRDAVIPSEVAEEFISTTGRAGGALAVIRSSFHQAFSGLLIVLSCRTPLPGGPLRTVAGNHCRA